MRWEPGRRGAVAAGPVPVGPRREWGQTVDERRDVAAGALDGAVGPHEGGVGAAPAQPSVQIGTGCGGDDDGPAALDLALLGRGRRGRGDQGETPGGEVVEAVGGVDGGVRAQLPGR